MATIINNPDTRPITEDSGAGIVAGVIVALVLIVLFVMYVVPTFNQTPAAPETGGSADINITLPASNSPAPAGGTTY